MGRVIVIGGGAGGMMAAIAAAEQGHHVILLEKNEKLGKKIYITGKGRCNVTNDCDMEELFDNVVTNSKFLYSAFYTFDNQRMKEYLEEDGCRLKVERGNRVFPVSDHASDVIGALKRRMNRLGVQVFLNTEVKEILKADGEDRVAGVLLTNGKKESAMLLFLQAVDYLILPQAPMAPASGWQKNWDIPYPNVCLPWFLWKRQRSSVKKCRDCP